MERRFTECKLELQPERASKSIRTSFRGWQLHRCTPLSLDEVVESNRPIVQAWVNYYGRFNRALLIRALQTLDYFVVRWLQRKYKNLKAHKVEAWVWLSRLKSREPNLLPHWQLRKLVGRQAV